MKKNLIQTIFLYLVALVGVIMIIIGAYALINLGLDALVGMDINWEYEKRNVADSLTSLIIGTPLFFWSWKNAKKISK